MLLIASVAVWRWLSPTTFLAASEKGNSLVLNPLKNSRPVTAAAAWLCATLSMGCPAAQIRPPPGDCPEDAIQSMRGLGIHSYPNPKEFMAVVDINQPGDQDQRGVFHEGKLVSRVVKVSWVKGEGLPDGTLLYGQLWTEGLKMHGEDAVLGRYTEALLPDGRRLPVCMVLGDWRNGLVVKGKGSKPDEARFRRMGSVYAVEIWP
jgi:serine/threonine-protein kinase